MKSVAVIGAGLAGLAAAWHLAEKYRVTIFEGKKVGGGASGASAGLMHPYPGEQGRKSWKSDEALAASHKLLAIAEAEMGRKVANYRGIVKIGSCLGAGSDVKEVVPGQFLIRSGVTVFVELYLDGLWRACQKKGVAWRQEQIKELAELAAFDVVIIAAGGGIRAFPECQSLAVNFLKGQVLLCQLPYPLERSIAAKHYTAVTENPDVCYFGSTYERDFSSEEPSLETACHLLQPVMPVLGVRAGIRVTKPGHYFPLVERLDARTWAITALGSRGLLYHAYLGELITKELGK